MPFASRLRSRNASVGFFQTWRRASKRETSAGASSNAGDANGKVEERQVLRDADGNPVDPSLVEFAGGGFGHAAVGVSAMALGAIAAVGLAGVGAYGAFFMASSAAEASGRSMRKLESKEPKEVEVLS